MKLSIKERKAQLRKDAEQEIITLLKATAKSYVLFNNITMLSEHNDKFIYGAAIDVEGNLAFIGREWFFTMFEVEDDNVFEVLEIIQEDNYFHSDTELTDSGYDVEDFEWIADEYK